MIFGAMREKAIDEIAATLWPLADKVILTQPSNSRALNADQLFKAVPGSFDAVKIVKTQTASEAIEMARANTPEEGVIVVTGSLYLVGEVRGLLNNK
jgi:dihydrofolate synthase/folylpolyglutamate synthase